MAKCLINGTNNNGNTGRAIEVMNFFVGKGLSPTQACAIAGNCYVESRRAYDPKSLNKNDCNESKTKCGPSYGLFQWHDVCTRKNPDGSWDESSCTGRFKNLKTYCANNRLDYTTMKGQLEFLWHENAGGFKEYFQTNNKLSIEAYTKWWERYWEVCGTCDHNARVSEAKRLAGIYNQMNKTECNVDTSGITSGNESSGNFSCSEEVSVDPAINLGDNGPDLTESAKSDGGVQPKKNMDYRPLFVGDSWADKIYHNDEYMKKNWTLLSLPKGKKTVTMQKLAKSLKYCLSNKYRRPKYIVVYCSDDTKLTDNTSGMFTYGSTDVVKKLCREILRACNGIMVYFCDNVMNSIYKPSKSNYYWTAASVLNRALRKIESEGDSSNFRIIHFDNSVREILWKNSEEIPDGPRMTLNPYGFSIMGKSIRNGIQNGV